MQPINRELKKIMDSQFQSRYNEMQKEILENQNVQKFLAENDQVANREMVERGLGKLYEYVNQHHDCSACESVALCKNAINGFIPKLTVIRGQIDLEYIPCQTKRMEDNRRRAASMISSMHMPKDVLKARIDDLDKSNPSKATISDVAELFIQKVRKTGELPKTGYYIYGNFGVGKSYVLGAIANELATMEIKTVMVYVPDFLSELKSAIGDQTLSEKVDFVKKAPVLMLDDIGAENLSAWTRDEIIGTILQYRMNEGLPVFITSNYDYDQLEKHFATTQKGEVDVMKAARIMERVKALTTDFEMIGENRRLYQD
ncbi:primosomal protein DnaI [Rummeliibacillus sp. TYF-LIM-RU47]|uniref:primosomal protein DnaI n=1 Tax=Rummeliibacillus sp. TYF-LIM-RU47 TaxID=2608406 RepID=UPI00123B6DB8|nr:primosomal protein DnaI [Rummeliibacillus sp. TYF-LIM-RU47]